jgi:hypothetical protein
VSHALIVMPGLVPGIHVLLLLHDWMGVDGRDKPGYDGEERAVTAP